VTIKQLCLSKTKKLQRVDDIQTLTALAKLSS